MDTLVIQGGIPLEGKVRVHGSKNAALPILAAAVLAEGEYLIDRVPELLDIVVMRTILQTLGVRTKQEGGKVYLDTGTLTSNEIPEHLMSQMRSSIFLMGPLLARTGEVMVSRPGGCDIGTRRIDLHMEGLARLGIQFEEREGNIYGRTKKLQGAKIVLDYPSVGATENIMMAATLAKGITRIINAAREPEIQDLQSFLNAMGARIAGAGSHMIEIEGVDRLHAVSHEVIPDRIVAGTLIAAAAITGGRVTLEEVQPDHMESVIEAFKRTGVEITGTESSLQVVGHHPILSLDKITTSPHPGFPTDMQPQMMAYLSLAQGTSIITETVFDGRFRHVDELMRMGAKIYTDYHTAIIRGVRRLSGTRVRATDLRAGAALVLAGLAAEGCTVVENVHHIDRGYDHIERMIQSLGGEIVRRK
ncbi:UDP-N-acetylglucosamine 1-carboxyvinyltransferase [Thermicanus aegyptius]|uniref:UDP-N-acetylglucosamine 1-carboxyvinyltransferase n=1 Tax=Thermicanus aegyptius TaxID=94009 RepID=UPI0003FC06C7|nr:UDP-N-acetylglucosamine 1-carboxyvinyltransferase [Thermicanus aegyptius]